MIALQKRGEQVFSSRKLEANLYKVSNDNLVTNVNFITSNYLIVKGTFVPYQNIHILT